MNNYYLNEMRDEEGGAYGDPRRCERHPDVVIGSPCGMFDGCCGKCEMEADDAMYDELDAEAAKAGPVGVAPRVVAAVDPLDIPF